MSLRSMSLRRMLSFPAAVLACAAVAAGGVRAQVPEPSPLDATYWGVVHDVPTTRDVTLHAGVPYLVDARDTLALDLYLPPDLQPGEAWPAVVFLNAIGDPPGNAVKDWGIYRTWPRLVAAHGLVGISMEADGARIDECLRAVFAFLAAEGARHGVDGGRVGVYAASANVSGAARFVLAGDAPPGLRAAVLYYGQAPAGELRPDLPVLFVVAASDAPGMRPQLDALWPRIVETGAPWTLVFGSGLPHAFDAFADTDDARRLIRQTLDFWKNHLEPVPAPPWTPSPARAIVASIYGGERERTLSLLDAWLADHPDDPDALGHYGRTLQQLGRLDEAGPVLERALAEAPEWPALLVSLAQVRAAGQRWEEAAALFERAIAAGAKNSFTYGQLALAMLHLGRPDEAVHHYEKALALGVPPGPATRTAYYNLACAYARAGRADDAFAALARAADEGGLRRDLVETDPDLASLHADARFADLLGRLEAAPGS